MNTRVLIAHGVGALLVLAGLGLVIWGKDATTGVLVSSAGGNLITLAMRQPKLFWSAEDKRRKARSKPPLGSEDKTPTVPPRVPPVTP